MNLTLSAVDDFCEVLADRIIDLSPTRPESGADLAVYGVPRGGLVPAALVVGALERHGQSAYVAEHIEDADFIVDDIIDSGQTAARVAEQTSAPFLACVSRRPDSRAVFVADEWVVFPWEETKIGSSEDIVTRFLQYIGEDATRGGLQETPARVVKAWGEWFRGYSENPADVLKTFEDGADKVNEMVLVDNIPVYSHCEHHAAPFFGVAHVAYIPDGRIVGLSKLVRLVDSFARRLQVQERLTNQIADTLVEHLNPLGVGVVLRCRHLCMESRGVSKAGTRTHTSAMRGALFDSPSARAEFFSLVRDR